MNKASPIASLLIGFVMVGATLGFSSPSLAGETLLVRDWMSWDKDHRVLYLMGAVDSAKTVLAYNPVGEITMDIDPRIPEMDYFEISDLLFSKALMNPTLLTKPFVSVLLALFTVVNTPQNQDEFTLLPHELSYLEVR